MTREGRLTSALLCDVALVGLLCAAKAAIDACVLRAGFSHVSDDDYARTVIAQQFANAPTLDPSGTSWLPLPFWITGAAMHVLGRSLAVARVVAILLGIAAAGLPFAAMRSVGASPAAALAASLVAMAAPWSAWLGAAMVPDGWTAALVAAASIALANDRARLWCAAGLLVASLARYEAWPACAIAAGFCGARAMGNGRAQRDVVCALVALAGPVLWMAWNAHAHGSPFHFVARVSAFRRAIGAANVPLRAKWLGFPRALLFEMPEASALGVAGLAGFFASAKLRRRWSLPAACAVAILGFLVAGDLGDGAPTHHAARALMPIVWILVGVGVDSAAIAIASLSTTGSRIASAAAAAAALAWVSPLPARWAAAPGNGPTEQRDAQLARGLELLRRGTASADVTPCQFEHFALIAAWGRPEAVHIGARTGVPVTAACPQVVTH